MNATQVAEDGVVVVARFDASQLRESDRTQIFNEEVLSGLPPFIRELIAGDSRIDATKRMTWSEGIMDSSVTQLRELLRDEVLGSPRFLVEAIQSPYEKAFEWKDLPGWRPSHIAIHTKEKSGIFSPGIAYGPVQSFEIVNTGYVESRHVRKLGHKVTANAKDLIGANGQGLKYAIIGLLATNADRIHIMEDFLQGITRGEMPAQQKQALQEAIAEIKLETTDESEGESFVTFQAKESPDGEYYRYYFFRVPQEDQNYDVQMVRVTLTDVEESEKDQVILAVHRPDSHTIRMLEELPNSILWMDSRYADPRSLVPPSEESIRPVIDTKQVQIWYKYEQYSVPVEVLDHTFVPGVYLDGQRLRPKDGTQVHLAYNIKTLGDEKLRNILIRSHESVELDGPVEKIIAQAVLQRTNPKEWQELLRMAQGKTDRQLRESHQAELLFEDGQLSEELAAIIRLAFVAEFGSATFFSDPSIQKLGTLFGIESASRSPVFEIWKKSLVKAGIHFADEEIAESFTKAFGAYGEHPTLEKIPPELLSPDHTGNDPLVALLESLPDGSINAIASVKVVNDGHAYSVQIEFSSYLMDVSSDASVNIKNTEFSRVIPKMQELGRRGSSVVFSSLHQSACVGTVQGVAYVGSFQRTGVKNYEVDHVLTVSGTFEQAALMKKRVLELRPDLSANDTQKDILAALEEGELSEDQKDTIKRLLESDRRIQQIAAIAATAEKNGYQRIVQQNIFQHEQTTRSELDDRPKGSDVFFSFSTYDGSPPIYFLVGGFDLSDMTSQGVLYENTSRAFETVPVSWTTYNPEDPVYFSRRSLGHVAFLETHVPLVPESGYVSLPIDGSEYEIALIEIPHTEKTYPPHVEFDEINNTYVLFFDAAAEENGTTLLPELPANTRIYLKKREKRNGTDEDFLRQKHTEYFHNLEVTDVKIEDLDSQAQEFFQLLLDRTPPLSRDMKATAIAAFWDRRRAYTKLGNHHESIAKAIESGAGPCPDGEIPLTHMYRLAGLYARSGSVYADYARTGSLRGSSLHSVTQYISDNGNWTKRDPPGARVTLDFVRMIFQQISQGKAPYVRDANVLNVDPAVEGFNQLPSDIKKYINAIPFRGVNLNAMLSNALDAIHNGELISIADVVRGVESLVATMGGERHEFMSTKETAKRLATIQQSLQKGVVRMSNDQINDKYMEIVVELLRSSGIEGLMKL